MSYKDIRSRYLLLARIFVLVGALGLGVLVYANAGGELSYLAYSSIAFIISVAALLMTILQSVSIARQVQMTEKAAHEIRETGEKLESLANRDSLLAREIHEDIELDHEIIAVLEEHGVGEDSAERHKVAQRIAQRLRTKHK